jgi:hypothetical protein
MGTPDYGEAPPKEDALAGMAGFHAPKHLPQEKVIDRMQEACGSPPVDSRGGAP